MASPKGCLLIKKPFPVLSRLARVHSKSTCLYSFIDQVIYLDNAKTKNNTFKQQEQNHPSSISDQLMCTSKYMYCILIIQLGLKTCNTQAAATAITLGVQMQK